MSMRKDKIFELKIQEDDEVSGIDSISLVDEPAIEVNWMFFKKEKEHEFHIPDGEDNIYIEKLMSTAQDEQELFNEGWVVDNIKVLGEQGFYSTDPNGPSIEDEKEYNVRYKYILKPGIAENSVIKTTRDFCKTLVSQNRVWRVEDMDATRNDFGDSALVWRGGYNCRHVWARIEYKKDATIINKASVNKGKVDVGGFPSGLAPDTRVLGYGQPSTVTSKTLGNPSPSTIKNLGLSKEGFADKPKVSIDYDGTLSTDKGKELYKELVDGGNDVYIVTARNEREGEPILALAKELRIPQSKVLFTDGAPKSDVLKRIGITKHYDNNPDVVAEINKNAPDVLAIKFNVGVPHYTKDGKLWTGPTHKSGGRLMTGAVHTADSVYLYHADELGYDVGGLPSYVDQLPKKKKRFEEEFEYLFVDKKVTCQNCGWEWNMSDGGTNPYVCHKCGYDNSPNKSTFESHSDYPDSVKNNAKAVLKYVEENGWGSCGTDVGKGRANDLSQGNPISEDTIRRMYSYLSRHAGDLDSSKGYGDGCGKLMYDAWGGKSALTWSESKIKSIEKQKMSKQYFATDSEKRIVLGPAMIPNQKIFRKDNDGNPYYVFFSPETIRLIAEKYMRNKYTDNNDTMHDGKAIRDIHVMESWIKEDGEDKSNKYGFENLPVGTWFVSMKVNNPNIWEEVKQGKLNGFSVSGYFEEVAQFTKEEMFLYKVAEVLKNIKD